MIRIATAAIVLFAGCTSLPVSPDPVALPAPVTAGVEHVVSGTVVEGSGAAVEGATIKSSSFGGPETVTDASGGFRLRAGISHTLFHAARAGYESRDFRTMTTPDDITVRVVMQPQIVVTEFTTTALTLFPADLPHYVGEAYESDYCSPCKMVRLRTANQPKLAVEVRWAGASPLALWTLGGYTKIEASAGAASLRATLGTSGTNEAIVYIGLPLLNGKPQQLSEQMKFHVITSSSSP